MTDPKPKAKPAVPTRTPGKKTAPGIFDNLRQLPHPVDEFLSQTQPIPTEPNPPQPSPTHPVAPVRDYNKRPNSAERALAEGLFPGTSQKLYNALYKRTRGAVVPVRTVKATKRELMSWSGIKSKNTIAVNLKILTSIGWLVSTLDPGDHEGNVYEVFVYEELPSPTQPKSSQPDPTRKLGGDPTQKSGWDGMGKVVDSQRPNEPDKTSFKTNTEKDDDERVPRPLRDAERELTDKNTASEKWDELWDVLTTELRIAAGRTTVSSVPAFLAEHLRRRLFKKDKRQLEAEASSEGDSERVVAVTGDISRCPDCSGTLYFYPNGYEGGVARCKHEKLSKNG